MGKLDGKVVALTGAGRGIGRALAKAMAAEGAAVVVNDLGVTLVGDREPSSPANDVVADIKAAGGRAVLSRRERGWILLWLLRVCRMKGKSACLKEGAHRILRRNCSQRRRFGYPF